MSFPVHDRYWVATVAYVQRHAKPGQRILANDLFWSRFPRVYRYRNTWLRPYEDYDWVILHKAELDRVALPFLDRVVETMHPTFANDVFAVWSERPELDDAPAEHVEPVRSALAALKAQPCPEPQWDDLALPDPGWIDQFRLFDQQQLRGAMDDFYRRGGYEYPTLRDQVYAEELDRIVAETVRGGSGVILDVCCGRGRSFPETPGAVVVGVDISEVAVAQARDRTGVDERLVAVSDAQNLAIASESADVVLLVDSVEHVLSVEETFGEITRVLRPGGTLLVTSANRDSLHLRLARAIGRAEHVTNNQHVSELTYTELVELLTSHGFEVTRSEGVLLFPFFGVAGVEEPVREAVDEDPELVAALREMGSLVGAAHAYLSVVVATKRPG